MLAVCGVVVLVVVLVVVGVEKRIALQPTTIYDWSLKASAYVIKVYVLEHQ